MGEPVQMFLKKGGMIVMNNHKDKLIPTHIIMG